jgi:hypothetical protein
VRLTLVASVGDPIGSEGREAVYRKNRSVGPTLINGGSMNRIQNLILLLTLIVAARVNASAYPMFLEMYKADKYTNPNNKAVICNFCHMSPSGGDERNPFGQAFEKAGEVFTPLLRAQFPDRFSYPMMKVDDNLTIHYSDPDNKTVVVETGGKKVAVDVTKLTVDGKPAAVAAIAAEANAQQVRPIELTPTATANPTVPQTGSELSTDPNAREGAFFGLAVVDLPDGKPQRKGGVDFWIGHRFPEAIFQSNTTPDLFGFDSTATVTFGTRVGLTDRLAVGITRSSYFRTIELNAAYQVSRQGPESPLTVQLRGSVEGRNNFIHTGDFPWVGYAPSIQVVAVRTFADRVSAEVVPTFAFNTRNENSVFRQFDANHNSTIAIGVAGGVRFLKTASIVGEVVPQVWGFRGEVTHRPTIGFGIEKTTYRHAFSLIFSDTRPMTVNRLAQGTGGAQGGLETFGIGFNIYRKIR